MNTRTTFFVALIVIAALCVTGGIVYFAFFNSPSSSQVNQSGNQSPFGNTGGSSSQTSNQSQASTTGQADKMLEIKTATGSMLVSDFTKGPGVEANPEKAYFSVSAAENPQYASTTPDYQLFYFPQDKSFLVSILKEPIGEIRRRAADDLANRLGILPKDLCYLVAEVSLPRGVNDFYTGWSLGFPGCPTATKFDGDPTF